ncbi:MAG: NAD(P)-binding domain-containing protein, partial [Bacteroidales bacterium]|nr:NAD(P)-binding domain-containing protein [Bacteroidales bacterium]
MMTNLEFDTIVVGGGHAGLGTSYFLKQHKLSHLVFERQRIGNSWSSQRWDSFKLNTPGKLSCLPGFETNHTDPDGFLSAQEFVSILEQYAKDYELPVMENSNVLSVEKASDSDLFHLTVSVNGEIQSYQSYNVVVASGAHSREIVPEHSGDVSPEIVQMHAAEYRNADDLPKGAVLVAGSGQSGVQIAEDLLDSGKKVFISTSMVARA